jgi:hypothetical protein
MPGHDSSITPSDTGYAQKVKVVTILGVLAFLLTAGATGSPANVSILLASPVDARLSISADAKGVVYPLEYRKRHGPFSFTAGKHLWAVKIGGSVIQDSSRTFGSDDEYLMAVSGPLADLDITWVKLELAPTAGAAKLRLVNLSADVPALSLRRGADTIYEALGYRKTGASVTVSPGNLPVELSRSDSGDRLLTLETAVFAAGKTYTLVAFGTAAKPELMVIEN